MRALVASTLITAAVLFGSGTAATAQDRLPPPTRPVRPATHQGKTDDIRARFLELLALPPTSHRVAAPGVAAAPEALGTETEPNDTITTANPVSLGDTIAGVIDPAGDYDFFAIDLSAGTVLEIDVDAQVLGSPLDAIIGLFDTDGSCCLVVNDDWDGLDSRIMYAIPTDGRYFAAILDYNLRGGTGYTYLLAFREMLLDEAEPNDTPASATIIALGDTATAALSPSTDTDYFAVDVPAGTLMEVTLLPFDGFDGVTTLYDVDGTTVLASDTLYGWWHTLEHFIEASGRYYISVRSLYPQASGSWLYGIAADSIPLGPGDPIMLFATGQGVPRLLAAGSTGELYVWDEYGAKVLSVSPAGVVTEVARDIWLSSMVVDGYGDILAGGYDYGSGRPVVWRFTPQGARSVFVDDGSSAERLTIGPDGDLWVTGCGQQCPALRRYDPVGQLKSVVAINDWPTDMAFSPGGQLHFATGDGVYRLSGTTTQRVITTNTTLFGLAFDQDGRLYVVPEPYPTGLLLRYSPTYQLMEDHFARFANLGTLDVAFGRDAAGAMTARLFVSAYDYAGPAPVLQIYEVNPDGVAAPGFRIGRDLLMIAAVPEDTVRMGAAYSRTLSLVNPPGSVTWTLESGALPPGVTLNASSGVLSGTPEQTGHYEFAVRATSGTEFGFALVTIVVIEPTLSVDDAVNAMLGVPGLLTPALETYLDLQGNHNGQCDIGDLRAFLRARGQLAPEPTSAHESERSDGQ